MQQHGILQNKTTPKLVYRKIYISPVWVILCVRKIGYFLFLSILQLEILIIVWKIDGI